MTFALTGASGQLGRLAAAALLDAVAPTDVVLITRRPESLAEFADRGADVRRADFDQPDTLPGALVGVDRLLLISGDQVGQRLSGQLAVIRAAVEAGVQHLLYTSIPGAVPENPAQVVPDHAATEQAMQDSGLGWTSLRNNLYADMQVSVVEQAAANARLVTNYGDGRVAFVTRADCARAAAAALVASPGGPVDITGPIDITGPAAVSARDLADLAAELRGAPVELVDVDDEAYVAGLVSVGVPQSAAELLASFGEASRLGFFAPVSDAVRQLSGRPPTSLQSLLPAS